MVVWFIPGIVPELSHLIKTPKFTCIRILVSPCIPYLGRHFHNYYLSMGRHADAKFL
jgi:hypothetical protein